MNNELKAMLVSVINEALQPIKDDIRFLKGEIQTLKSGQNELQQLARAIYDRKEETDARLEALTMDVQHATGDITSLKQVQARQEKIIGTLSLRSLEQETDLRELKYA